MTPMALKHHHGGFYGNKQSQGYFFSICTLQSDDKEKLSWSYYLVPQVMHTYCKSSIPGKLCEKNSLLHEHRNYADQYIETQIVSKA